jgi:hypothetical protein
MKKRTVLWVLVACLALAAVALAGVQQDAISVTTREQVPTRATALGDPISIPYPMKITPTTGSVVHVDSSSTSYTLPTTGSRAFRITCGAGLSSYAMIKCGAGAQTATCTAATGYNLPAVSDGQTLPMRELPSTTTICAVIGCSADAGTATAGGSCSFEQVSNPTGMAFGS